MATIQPLRGLRYHAAHVPNLADVITPPYDVIDAAAQEAFYRRHPYNIIRLEYGRKQPTDSEQDNRYTRAAAEFAAWQEQGVLQPDPPAVYIYHQYYPLGGETRVRKGLVCAVKLEPYEKGVVLPHEETLPKHKADRLALMQACRANFSPIFALYEDAACRVEQLAETGLCGQKTCLDFTDDQGQRHRLWAVSDPGMLREIAAIFDPLKVYIADGHHRYETALQYARLRRQEENVPPGQTRPYDYVLMVLVNMHDPGLVVLPTHRLVRNVKNFDPDRLVEDIKEHFTVEEYAISRFPGGLPAFLQQMHSALAGAGKASRHAHIFGLYAGRDRLFRLQLKEGLNLEGLLPPGHCPAWQQLDVTILHSLVLEKRLGIGRQQREGENFLTYTRQEEEALQLVDSGSYQMVFFLNPTLVSEVMAVAAAGDRMPQKSTYFYPKLPTGLVINKL